MNNLLTVDQLRDILEYDHKSGIFTWLRRMGTAKAGNVAGTINSRGYCSIRINNRFYLAHRLAWLHYYGVWPDGEIDHKNQDKSDNRIDNLRDVTHSQNMHNRPKYANNKSGFRGVSWNKSLKLWRAELCVNKTRMHLGYFSDVESAYAAYTNAREARGGNQINGKACRVAGGAARKEGVK